LFAGLSVSRITENITNDFVTFREIYGKDKKTIDYIVGLFWIRTYEFVFTLLNTTNVFCMLTSIANHA